jgi:hypothetical protein
VKTCAITEFLSWKYILYWWSKLLDEYQNKQVYRGVFVERLTQTWAAQQSATKFITTIVVTLVATKAAAKLDLSFNEPASIFLQKFFVHNAAMG